MATKGTRILAIASAKGGVGKTTLSVGLATANALAGRRTLLIDAEPQANAAAATVDPDLAYGPGLADLLTTPSSNPLGAAAELIIATRIPGLDLLPPGPLDAAAQWMVGQRAAETLIATRVTDPIAATGVYDLIILDTPPSVGRLTDAALTAAGAVISPLRVTEPNSLGGITDILNTLTDLAPLNPGRHIGIIATDATKKGSATQKGMLKAARKLDLPVLAEIAHTEAIPKAAASRLTPQELTPKGRVVDALADALKVARKETPTHG